MVHYKTEEEIDLIRESGVILGKTHGEVAKWIKPGTKTRELDRIAEEYIRDHDGKPSFKGFNGFPGSLCISVNEQVVHGIPGDYELKEGDIVSIDCGVLLNDFHSDSAYTYPVDGVEPEVLQLLKVTRDSLKMGIEKARAGNRIGDIGYAVQHYVEGFGYSVIRELVGHGLGKSLHESPEVPNYGKRGRGQKLKPSMQATCWKATRTGSRRSASAAMEIA